MMYKRSLQSFTPYLAIVGSFRLARTLAVDGPQGRLRPHSVPGRPLTPATTPVIASVIRLALTLVVDDSDTDFQLCIGIHSFGLEG